MSMPPKRRFGVPSLLSAVAVACAMLAALLPASTATAAPSSSPVAKLSNGCSISERGIPSCGALMGGAYKANHDPAPWEKELGSQLGVHRLFFSAGQVSGAVKKAQASVNKGRVPWVSFKVPHSWKDMANGKGDAWAKDIAKRFSALNGPVWIAFHHEPETDGDMQLWKRMQERLGPIVRNNASNVGFSVILMGYHEFYGSSQYAMSKVWPNTKVDMAGFDVYDHYGKNGQKKHTDMDGYFSKIQSWSKGAGVPWGLAETGISHAGAADMPGWFQDTYNKLVNRGGKAFAYFNTSLNSFQDWTLSTSLKKEKFRAAFRQAPSL